MQYAMQLLFRLPYNLLYVFNKENKMPHSAILKKEDFMDFKDELKQLIENTTDHSELIALRNFKNALEPMLDDPEKFKTLLGKIQRAMIMESQ